MGDNTKGTMAEIRADGGLIFGPHSTTLSCASRGLGSGARSQRRRQLKI